MNSAAKIRNGNEFATNPRISIPRTRFNSSSEHKTTFNVGELIPTYWKEVLPGDTHEITISEVLRTSTMTVPVMDNMYRDTFAFFVPTRLLWTHWKEFNGENRTDKWTQKTKYTTPKTEAPTGGWLQNSLADYFGIPTKVNMTTTLGNAPTSFLFRAYTLIVNEWFKDQNNQNPAALSLDDTNTTGSNGTDYTTDLQKGGKPFIVNKYHDYFTSALPEPQKGDAVTIPLTGNAPIIGKAPLLVETDEYIPNNGPGPKFKATNGSEITGNNTLAINSGILTYNAGGEIGPNNIAPVNLWAAGSATGSTLKADLSNVSATTINELRMAIQTQELLEKDARGGTRYVEMILEHFGVRSEDARQQRPEFLGGSHLLMNVQQVPQTSATNDKSPQANLAAFSLTNNKGHIVTKSFTEHGYIIILTCVRTNHTYQQGLNRALSRNTREDYYLPVLANLGEQAILNKEIYANGTATDNEVFGYQMRYGEYHYDPSRVSGEFRSNATTPLDFWHYADKYESLPVLGQTWIAETKDNVDRTLAVKSSVSNQIIADFYFDVTSTRPMPMNPVPRIVAHGM